MTGSFYEELIGKSNLDDLIRESSKNLEKKVNSEALVVKNNKNVVKYEEENYEALKAMGEETYGALTKVGKGTLKVGKGVAYMPFRALIMPTTMRSFEENAGDCEALRLLAVPLGMIGITLSTMGGFVNPLYFAISGTYILSNIVDGLYEWHRHEKNKLRKDKNGK